MCWVADCEVCGVPMVVWKQHGPTPPEAQIEHMLAQLSVVADGRFGADGWSVDRVMRQIPNHFHAHGRDPELVVPPARSALSSAGHRAASPSRLDVA